MATAKQVIDENQYKYLTNLAKGITSSGGQANAGQIAWAKAQLANSIYQPMSAQTAAKTTTTTSSVPKTTTTTTATPKTTSTSTTGMSASTASKVSSSPTPIKPTYNEQPVTNYGGAGNPYNEILYSKKLYDQGVSTQNEGLKNWAAQNAQQYYSMLSADEAAKIRGMNTQELIDYLNGNRPEVSATDQLPQPDQPLTPEDFQKWMQGFLDLLQQPNVDDFKSIAEAEFAQQLADRKRIAEQQKEALQQAYERANQVLRDNRVLEDLKFARNNSPFSGRTNYAAGLLARERQLADEAAQQNLLSALSGIDQGLADFQNTAAQQVLARAYQLAQDARQENRQALDSAFNKAMELLGFNRDTIGTMAELTGKLPDGTPTTAEQQRQLENLWTVADYTGVIPDELADMYGIKRGTPTQSAKQFVMEYNLQNRQVSNAIANANADNARANRSAEFSRLMGIWEATGYAPEGMDKFGVTPGTPWRSNTSAGNETVGVDAKTSAENLSEAKAYVRGMSKATAKSYVERIRDYFTDSDYRELIEYIDRLDEEKRKAAEKNANP